MELSEVVADGEFVVNCSEARALHDCLLETPVVDDLVPQWIR